MDNGKNRVCPVEMAGSLDSRIRRWLQNPQRILSPYIKEGMTVLDIGCGPGFFSVEMAKMVGSGGRVISADLQEGMLLKVKAKIQGTRLEERIKLVKCDRDKTNISDKFDFGLAFYVVHEIPDKESLFKELKSALNQKGRILIVEPKWFHVSKKDFLQTTDHAKNAGFDINKGPALPFSWSAILTNS
ncbi:MAG: methyltransferase domain-containing protein [Bacteroidetes bacterium]|nr:methyltransferase domain-containing protein [Bacteroidota bacterium]